MVTRAVIPIRASERLRQFGVVPRREIVVGPVRVFFQRPLDEIAAIVEDEDNDVGAEPSHGADVVRRQLMGAFAGDQHDASVGIGKRDAERSRRRPTDRSPQNLRLDAHAVGEDHGRNARTCAAGFEDDSVARAQERRIARIKRVHGDLVGWLAVHRRQTLRCFPVGRR